MTGPECSAYDVISVIVEHPSHLRCAHILLPTEFSSIWESWPEPQLRIHPLYSANQVRQFTERVPDNKGIIQNIKYVI